MKLSYNWLNDYITLPKDVRETADTLTLIGLEEEETITVGANLDGIITGEILNIEKHPNADRLSVCTVYNGTDELSIVCGASNVEPGQKVAVAPINSQLPIKDEKGRPIVIKKTKLRGVVSEGMICAEDELGLSQDHSGIMVLPKDTPVGVPLSTVVHSYEDDIIEIAITPNRPDATSHIGVARDLSAKWNKPLKVPSISKPSNLLKQGNTISIHIDDTSGCHRYVGILIDNITIEASPKWLSQRLEAIGLRSIN
ncbi:MAG: phenylalanine--tRNA ligase subunit beta, partial [Bacteroidota bacterium]